MKAPVTCPECKSTTINEVSTSLYVSDRFEWTGRKYVHKEKHTKDQDEHYFECADCFERVTDEAMETLLDYV